MGMMTGPRRAARAWRVRAAALCVILVVTPPSGVNADEPVAAPVDGARPTRAMPPAPAVDAASFCPRPSGRWWEDLAARGCVELLAGRDLATPLTYRELGWLDLGGLPAYATVDVDAISGAITAFEQRLAEEATAAATAERTPRASRTSTRSGGRSDEGWPRSESDAWGECLDRVPRPPDESSLQGPAWSDYMVAVATCTDAEYPGFLAEFLRDRDKQQRDLEDALARTRQQQQALRNQHNPAAVSAALDALAAGATRVALLLYGEADMVREDLDGLMRTAIGVLGGSANCFSGFSKWMARELDPWNASISCERS